MKNEQQRIWNKSELKKMPDWDKDEDGDWYNKSIDPSIVQSMLGKTVQWCKKQGYTVTPKMIAKTETLESLQQEKVGIEKIINESDCSTDMLVNFTKDLETVNGKIKTLTEQPKTAIASNGTELVVGGRYRLESWSKGTFIEILFIGEKFFFVKYQNGDEYSWPIDDDWLPYTNPKEEPKPLEEIWTKTMDLRWWSNPKLGTLNYLQQKHISNLGNEKWVDVESVTI